MARIKRRLFYYTVRFARWACWLRAIDPKDVDLWIEKEKASEQSHRPESMTS